MSQRLVIVGGGFAGMYAALSASRLRNVAGASPEDFKIALVAPEPTLVVRPRLYEAKPETMTAPLGDLFDAIDVIYIRGRVGKIDAAASAVEIVAAEDEVFALPYDRLVLASGSRLFRPPIPGLAEHGFSVDQLDDAITLDRHLARLAAMPATKVRNTVVVAGGGFTGIEVATEMPARLRAVLGEDAEIRVVIVDRGAAIASDMGTGARPFVEEALRELGIETRLGNGVEALDGNGVTLSNGERIESNTVIWAAGMRASLLTEQIPAERDRGGRLLVDPLLRVHGIPSIYAAGDTAQAVTDAAGHIALMSCQHANRLGAVAGHNAAADLLGVPPEPYQQKSYVTCLDLGAPGALFTRGWDRVVEMTGEKAKRMKREINTQWIYPPPPDPAEAFKAAEWARLVDY